MTDEWHRTACILCSVNCGLEVRIDGADDHTVRGDKAHPASEGYTCKGPAHRPLPEQPAPAHDAVAPPPRRHVRGDRLGHRDRRVAQRFQDVIAGTAATRSCSTAVAVRATISVVGTAARPLGARHPLHSNALAQEKTGEFWVDGQLFGR